MRCWVLSFILALSSAFSLIYTTPTDDLVVSLKEELRSIYEPLPPTTATLLSSIHTNFSYNMSSATSDTLDSIINSWFLPADVTALFQQSAYATDERFQTFTFNAAPSYVFFEEYLGAAKRVNDDIALAYMHVKVDAIAITQKTSVSTRTCHKCWLIMTCCSSAQVMVPRGFLTSEITTMMSALRATAYQALLAQFPLKSFLSYRVVLKLPESF